MESHAGPSDLKTPSKKSHPRPNPSSSLTPTSAKAVGRFLRGLADEFNAPDLQFSNTDTDGGKCRGIISLLFFRDKQGLEACINAFRRLDAPDRRLSRFLCLLQAQRLQSRRRNSLTRASTTFQPSRTTSLDTDTTSANRSFDTSPTSATRSFDTSTTSATRSFDTSTTSATRSFDTSTSATHSFDTDITSAARSFDTDITSATTRSSERLHSRSDGPPAVFLKTTFGDGLDRPNHDQSTVNSFYHALNSTDLHMIDPLPCELDSDEPPSSPTLQTMHKSLSRPLSPRSHQRKCNVRAEVQSATNMISLNITTRTFNPDISRKANITSFFNQSKSVAPSLSSNAKGTSKATTKTDTHAEIAKTRPLPGESPAQKPTLEHWQTKELPDGEFFTSDLPRSYRRAPLRLRYETLRYALYHDSEPQALDSQFPNGFHDPGEVRTRLSALGGRAVAAPPFEQSSPSVWEKAGEVEWPPYLTMSTQLSFRTSNTLRQPALRLTLKPLQLQKKTNRFFRKFGAHRFLRVTVPASEAREFPSALNSEKYLEAIIKWLTTPGKRLLGCSWTAVFLKPVKATVKSQAKVGGVGGQEVFFFAEEGPGLTPITKTQVLHWFVDSELNKNLPACKLYSRLELGFSSITPTIVFRPDQIIPVENVKSNGAIGDVSLRDLSFDWRRVDNSLVERDMNDGCDTISPAAAAEVWRAMRGRGPVPSCFQARIGPYKGVWTVAPPSQLGSNTHDDVWIKVNPTQTKFTKHKDDNSIESSDPLRLTFDVVTYSHSPKRSYFYHEFIPILRDRKVPLASCVSIVLESLEAEKLSMQEALNHSTDFLRWIQSRSAQLSTQEHGTDWCGEHEKTRPMRVQSLIQSGFKVKENAYFNTLAMQEIKWHMTNACNELRIVIANSTSVIGVPDPVGVLAPDEICLNFSDAKVWGTSVLDRVDALVSRHPACRASDMQKVRIAHHPELDYLRDVVVFPVTGCFPLAGKLQGGDYDGDTFWVCWEPALVKGFLNAPPPVDTPHPKAFGITVDRSTCGDYLQSEDFATCFLRHNFKLQLQPSFLGQVTNLLKRVRYTCNSMWHPTVLDLAAMHDLLVDSSKNGYTFSDDSYKRWKGKNTLVRKVRDPRYDDAPSMALENDTVTRSGEKLTDDIDILVFEYARPRSYQIFCEVEEAAGSGVTFDDIHLQDIWDRFKGEPMFAGVIRQLQSELKSNSHFYEPWLNATRMVKVAEAGPVASDEIKSISYNAARRECRRRFLELQPFDPSGTLTVFLTYQSERHGLSLWDKMKACTLYEEFKSRPGFYFPLAGEVFCKMKADSFKGTESFVAHVACNTKVRKRKFEENPEDESGATILEAEQPGANRSHDRAHSEAQSKASDDWVRMELVKAHKSDDSIPDAGVDVDTNVDEENFYGA